MGGCGITEEVSQWMENIQNSAVEELPIPMSKDVQKLHRKQQHKKAAPQQQQQHQPHPHPPKKYASGDDDFKLPHQKYTKEANFAGDGAFYDPETGRRLGSAANVADWHEAVHERVRRASGGINAGGSSSNSGSSNASGSGRGREDNKNTCSLYIQTDPLIWRHIREGIADVSLNLSANRKGPLLSGVNGEGGVAVSSCAKLKTKYQQQGREGRKGARRPNKTKSMNFAIFYERTLHFAAARIKQKAPASSAPSAQREATDSLKAGKERTREGERQRSQAWSQSDAILFLFCFVLFFIRESKEID